MPGPANPAIWDFRQVARLRYAGKQRYRLRSTRLYKVGKGEQAFLYASPTKAKTNAHWRFKIQDCPPKAAPAIYKIFETALAERDFVGGRCMRVILQMGYLIRWDSRWINDDLSR